MSAPPSAPSSIPPTCRGIVCVKLGDATLPVGAGVMEVQQVPVPAPRKGFVKVKVEVASLNFADPLTVKGTYQVRMKPPFVPGAEGAGRVVAVGPGVTKFKVGDRVTAFCQGGMFAQEALVHESSVWAVPEGVDLSLAAALPVTYGTADVALRHRCNLQAGQTVLVLGAGGGVGVAAIQLAKAVGAKVVAVTQGARKVEFVRKQGADAVVDLDSVSASTPLHQHIKQHAPKGVNVVIDPVGGQLFFEALKTLAWGAHVVVIGFAAGGDVPKIPANILLVKNTTVHGLYWGSYLQFGPQVLQRSMDDIMAWLQQGKVRPHVSHTFPLDQLPAAFKCLFDRQMLGKIQLDVNALSSSAPSGGLTSKL